VEVGRRDGGEGSVFEPVRVLDTEGPAPSRVAVSESTEIRDRQGAELFALHGAARAETRQTKWTRPESPSRKTGSFWTEYLVVTGFGEGVLFAEFAEFGEFVVTLDLRSWIWRRLSHRSRVARGRSVPHS
jgi:hypothetical protein